MCGATGYLGAAAFVRRIYRWGIPWRCSALASCDVLITTVAYVWHLGRMQHLMQGQSYMCLLYVGAALPPLTKSDRRC